ncbi:MAG: PAS domain S-box protein [Bacteroidetes bacterium]|nr:PAS domain S-box protein [Bacteroidota bacterium]
MENTGKSAPRKENADTDSFISKEIKDYKGIYEHLFKTTSNAVYFLNNEGTILDANPAAGKMLRRAPEEIRGMEISEIDPEFDKEKFLSFWDKHEPGKSIVFESRHLRKDGSLFPVEVIGMNFLVNGKVYLFGIVRDLTADKKKDADLKESRDLFRNAFEYSGIGMALSDAQGNYITVNNAFAEMFGYSREEMIGVNFKEITHEEDLPGSLDKLKEMTGGMVDGYEIIKRYRHKNGKILYGRLNMALLREDDNSIKYMIAQVQDVTDHYMADKAMEESEKLLKEAQNLGNIGSWKWDVLNGSLKWSDQLYSMWGFDRPKDLSYEMIEERIHPDDRDYNNQNVAKALKEDDHVEYEFRIIKPDGEIRNILQRMIVTRDNKGNTREVFGIMQDISDRVAMEEALKESDRLKSVFLANMSHEIRTPMNAIIGFSSLLGDAFPKNSKTNMYVQIIQSSGERLMSLIDDIIDVSKIELNKLKIERKSCDINMLIQEVVIQFRNNPLLRNKPDLKIIQSIPSSMTNVLVKTDPLRLKQILDNLMSNAVKHTDKGFVELGYEMKESQGFPYLEFFVRDTGVGIPADSQPFVFDRFYQVESNKFKEGTGLGLSICKGLVELLGGKIMLESRENEGSRFFFTIPFDRDEVVKEKEKREKPKMKTIDLQGKLIYIAEDDLSSFHYLEAVLDHSGAKLIHCMNGQLLLDQINKIIPDLILLDINMPVMDGYDFMAELTKKNISVPVIALTAYAMPEENVKCVDSGCVGYISKPARKVDILAEIYNVLHPG